METEYEISELDRAAMAAADAAHVEHERREEQRRQSVLAEVKRVVSEKVYAEIVEELAEEGTYTFDYEITASPVGREQDDDAAWGKTYVNQTTNGGYAGDEYAGTVSIPLADGRFFRFGYSM